MRLRQIWRQIEHNGNVWQTAFAPEIVTPEKPQKNELSGYVPIRRFGLMKQTSMDATIACGTQLFDADDIRTAYA